MKTIIFVLVFAALAMPLTYWCGYNQGAFNQRTLDAASRARLVAKLAELYEHNDPKAHTLIYTYLDTELSMYEEFLDEGIPWLASFTFHKYFLTQSREHIFAINDYVQIPDAETNEYKLAVKDTLKRIDEKMPSKSSMRTSIDTRK